MKFTSVAATILALALPVFSQEWTLTYDNIYDNASESLNVVACSTGVYGLETLGYTTFGSLPTFPNIGGVYAVTGWDSSFCGTCWEVTHGETTVTILAVDTASEGFNLSQETMDTLTAGLAIELGVAQVTAVQVDASKYGL